MSKTIEMADIMRALEKVRDAPVLTSNQCWDLAQALNAAAPVVERQDIQDWAIDHSAWRPILTLKGCSVIEAEDAAYVLSLVLRDQSPPAPVAVSEIEAIHERHEAWMAGVENGKASAGPAIDENAEFDKWRNTQIDVLVRNGYPEGAEAFRNLGSVQWAGWQARACLNKVKELNQ